MARNIYVNLPVKGLKASMAFFGALGFTFNPKFTDETAAGVTISEGIHAMLLTHKKFQGFIPNEICDTAKAAEVLICISCDGRAEVDEMHGKAVAAGGTEVRPASDHGFMYGRSFRDLDGHVWELMWMDPAAFPAG